MNATTIATSPPALPLVTQNYNSHFERGSHILCRDEKTVASFRSDIKPKVNCILDLLAEQERAERPLPFPKDCQTSKSHCQKDRQLRKVSARNK